MTHSIRGLRLLPTYEDVLGKFLTFKKSLLEKEKTSGLTNNEIWNLQDCVVLGLQVLIPPLRAKPFWSLQQKDSVSTSILLSVFGFPFFLISDCYILQERKTRLVIRHHKTSRSTGNLVLELPSDASEIFQLWVLKYRPMVALRSWLLFFLFIFAEANSGVDHEFL